MSKKPAEDERATKAEAREGEAAFAVPPYWDEACKHLKRRDRVLKRLIPMFGEARLQSRGDAFTTLARSVVGQQISVKAAQSVWNKFAALAVSPKAGAQPGQVDGASLHARVVPELVVALETPALRAAGLSARKCEYLKDLALHFTEGRVHQDQWAAMDDESIIQELIAIRGIGRWTAEMFLMFHLLRPDILPLDDLGVLKGISVNYFSGEPVTRAEARDVAEAWTPYRSVATWYLWRSLDPVPVDY
jgi:DNA-3-methyladenine glycosylase II